MALVLVIDDSAYTRNLMSKALAKDGHQIIQASDGAQGLHVVCTQNPQCVILDLIMPQIDGFKILKALQEKDARLPVIVVTADIQDAVRQQCMDLGATAFLNKPVKEEELRNMVGTVLRGKP